VTNKFIEDHREMKTLSALLIVIGLFGLAYSWNELNARTKSASRAKTAKRILGLPIRTLFLISFHMILVGLAILAIEFLLPEKF